jgi:hypothetical protein
MGAGPRRAAPADPLFPDRQSGEAGDPIAPASRVGGN